MKSIIYNDINDTRNTFFVELGKVKVYFSSEFNLRRFKNGFNNYIYEETMKLENKYHVSIVANYYLMIAYYKKIEKRGFRIENVETGTKLRENIIFHIEI